MKNLVKLSDIQRTLAQSILGASSDELASIICEKPPISSLKRIGIYQDAYRIRMLESLRDDFSRVEEQLDSAEFDRLAQAYIFEFPSRYASLAEFSQHFPEFLKKTSNELFELASIDWIEILSTQARGIKRENILSVIDIQSGAPCQLVLNPTLFFFKGTGALTISYRRSDEVFVKVISPSEFVILELLTQSMSVDKFSIVLGDLEKDITQVQSLISSFIQNEIIYCERA